MKKWEIELEKTLARFYGYGYNFIQEVGIYIVYGWLLLYSKKGTKNMLLHSKEGRNPLPISALVLFLWLPRRDVVEGVGKQMILFYA